ncbi:MAG: HlyD family secretion protein [Verrucomicrobiae bacterium]|nr:HlyD family secretion protein [Verrucomicrobiae bacterium]
MNPHPQHRICHAWTLRCWTGRIMVVMSCGPLMGFGLTARGDEYSAKGHIRVETRVAATGPGKTNGWNFYVEAIGDNYKVRIEDLKSADDYYEYACENGVMHIVHHVLPVKSPDTPAAMPLMFPARIEEREIPPNDGTRAQFVWFALAAHGFFRTLSEEVMLPIWSPEDPKTRRQPFPMAVFAELLSAPPHLPARVSFVNDGFYRSYNPVTEEMDVRKLAPPYDSGFTNAIYQVLSLTNTAKHTLPARFVFAVYSSPIRAGDVPFERVLVRGWVDEVADHAREKAQIARFTGEASVVDYRIRGTVQSLGQTSEYQYGAYPVTNAHWLNPDQRARLRGRIEHGIELRHRSTQHANRRLLIIALLGLLSIPLAWGGWRGLRQKPSS